ncbi:MAG: hypothetical protein M3342_13580 [Bacteroidota bacterium]|nr:hypothetical protein [Bacteroidota bacterium]
MKTYDQKAQWQRDKSINEGTRMSLPDEHPKKLHPYLWMHDMRSPKMKNDNITTSSTPCAI